MYTKENIPNKNVCHTHKCSITTIYNTCTIDGRKHKAKATKTLKQGNAAPESAGK